MKQLIILLLVLLQTSSFAQQKGATPIQSEKQSGERGNTYAVVVGISDYQDPAIPDLRFADKDAEAFANFLRSDAGGKLDHDHLKVLINQQATMAQFANALDWLWEVCKEGDQAIIYFSGHGDVEKKSLTQPGFLLCWDAPAKVYMAGGAFALPMLQEVISTLSVQNKAKVVVITDACHSGALSGSTIGGSQATAANLVKQYANEIKILSCQPNEYSIEGEQWGGGRGAFSFNLLDALYGLADGNKDLTVTLQEIGRYLEDHVTAEVAPVSQVPMVIGNRNERIATVNPSVLATFQSNNFNQLAKLSSIESRGVEEEVLSTLDSSTRMIYLLFKKSLEDETFLEPVSACSESYYKILISEPKMKQLHSTIKRNYAAALQEKAQQTLNLWLNTNINTSWNIKPIQKLTFNKFKIRVESYVKYLDRAAELLGNKHYMYNSLKARKSFFEGYLLANTHLNPDKELGERAMTCFRQSLKWEPDQPHVYWQMSRVFGWNIPQADSVTYYTQAAINLYPNWIKPKVEGAFLLFQNFQQFSKARPYLEQAIQIDSASVELLNVLALYYLKQNKLQEAENYLRKAISIDSTDVYYWYNLAVILKRKADYKNAEDAFKNSIMLDSTFAPAWAMLGSLYTEINRFSEAEHLILKSLQIDSLIYTGYLELGILYKRTNRFNEAELFLKKAVSIDPKNGEAYNELGILCLITARLEEAENLIKQAVNCDSANLGYQLNLGYLYTENRQYEKAFETYKKVISLDSLNAFAYGALGYAYMMTLKYEEAELVFRKSILLDSTIANPFKHLGMVYFEMNRLQEAKENLQKAVQLNPNYYQASLGLSYCSIAEQNSKDALNYIEQAILKACPYDQLEKDVKLATLRNLQEWNVLMKKYFPQQYKDK